jgi:hypothetical protein
MSERGSSVRDLPSALSDGEALNERLAGRHPAVFLEHLLEALDLDHEEIVALYVGDDITDEHAFEALKGTGVGVFVGDPDDPELAGPPDRCRLCPHLDPGGRTIPGHPRAMSAVGST